MHPRMETPVLGQIIDLLNTANDNRIERCINTLWILGDDTILNIPAGVVNQAMSCFYAY